MTLAASLLQRLRLSDPVELFRRSVGETPDAWQAAILTSPKDRLILNVSRQSGKSTVAAVLAVGTALGEPGSLTILAAPTERQAGESARMCRGFLDALGQPLAAESALRLELPSGSRIVALPGTEKTVRGLSAPALVVIDEAARVPDELFYALRPMLATSKGRLMLLSTPWGKRGEFYQTWEYGGEEWEKVRITAEECPRITPAFLDQELASMPDYVFRQEYMAEFSDSSAQVFGTDLIERALSDEVRPLFPERAA
jgi:hypothetical protein